MRRIVRKAAGIAVACGLVLAGTGCGDSGSDGETTAAGGSQDAPTMTVGVVGAFTGIPGMPNASPDVIEAWEESVNAAGGVNGHQVRVVVKDVGTRTGAGRAAAQELIDKEGVVAIVSQDFNDGTWVRYAEEKSVPVVNAQNGTSPFVSGNVFPIAMSPITLGYALAVQFEDAGGTGAVAYAAELAGGDQIANLIKQFAGTLDVEVPVMAKLPSSQPDYTPFCQQMKDAGVDAYVASFGTDVARKIAEQCFAQRAGGTQVLQAETAQPSWKDNPAYDGSGVVDSLAPFFDESIPAIRTYREALARYAPEVPGSTGDNGTPLFVWAGAQMIAAAAERVDGEITSESLRAALYTMKDETLDGLIAPATYTEGATSAIRCWFNWKVADGEFVPPAGGRPQCAPEAAVRPAEAALARSLGG